MADFDLGGLLFGNAPSSGLEGYLDPEQLRWMQQQGVMQAAMALLKASGPSTQRVGLGQALGEAYGAGQAGYQQAQQQGIAGLLTKQKMEEALRKKRLEDFFIKGIPLTGAGTPPMEQVAMPMAGAPIDPLQAISMPGYATGPTVERANLIGTTMPMTEGPTALAPVTVTGQRKVKPSIFANLSQEQRMIAAMDPDKAIPKLFEESLKQESFDTVTGADAADLGLDPKGRYQINNRTGQVTTLQAPGDEYKIVTGKTAGQLGLPERGRWQINNKTNQATLIANPEGAFGGGLTGGAYDILLNADVGSAEYALAYREANKPILQDQVQADGSVKQVLVTPAPLGSEFPKPTFKGRTQTAAVATPPSALPSGTQVRPAPFTAVVPSPVTAMTSPAEIPSGTKSTPYAPTSEQVGQAKKQIGTAMKLYSAVDELEKDINKNGLQTFGLGEAGGRQGAYFQDALLQLKELQNLGVLNGPDERILLQELADPTSIMTILKGGPGYMMSKIKVLKEKAVRESNLINSQFPKPIVNLPSTFTMPAAGTDVRSEADRILRGDQ